MHVQLYYNTLFIKRLLNRILFVTVHYIENNSILNYWSTRVERVELCTDIHSARTPAMNLSARGSAEREYEYE